MEEGSSEAAVRDGGALSAPSVGTEAVARKTVKMSETRDFIPCTDASEGDSSRSSGSSAAAADVASCTARQAALPDDDADADAEMHHTPDYARRRLACRLRIAPLELFSAAAPSPPAVPRPPAKPAFAESAAAPEAGAGGGAQEEATSAGRQIAQHVVAKGDGGDCCGRLRQEYDSLLREKGECRRVLEDLMRENELKTKECREAQTSLRDLQMELMRKSMHVGSLAFAVEGQVKEKTRWCQLLKDLSEKFKALKTEHQILLKESEDYKKCLSDATQMTTTIHQYVSQYASLESEFKDLKEKFSEEAKERKDLYNKLIELKGNIRVFCRCRPLNTEETAEGASMAIDFDSAKDGELIVRAMYHQRKSLNSIQSSTLKKTKKVFEKTAPFATSVLDGFNVCIFAYGQTGTGKTFTMEGTEGARGVNYRILDELFRVVKDRHDLFQYEITVSALEVYNEQIHDLLLTGSQPSTTTKRLEVRQVAEGVHHVLGLVEARVTNMDEAWDVLQTGSKARVVEAQNINKSLSALGDVISALATKSQHIPFRNSKLTHLLQDSLSGDSKTLMFVQFIPNENDVGETLCSLNFASRIKELESQLLVERKIARQHVDNKIAQDVERKQQLQSLKMEESNTHLRSPMSERNLNATAERPSSSAAPRKDLGMMAKQPFSDSNNNGDTYSFNQLMSLAEEKENASRCRREGQEGLALQRRGSPAPGQHPPQLAHPAAAPQLADAARRQDACTAGGGGGFAP
ncbi:hypothetical protein ZWY2020_030036 [Hordeum vulgare]|nr:hypothetical protein ZWY2020_030036 [Hordeum vulgare]